MESTPALGMLSELLKRMRATRNQRRASGLTVPEVLVIAALLAIIALLILPALSRPHHHRSGSCSNNLKQIGLSFRVWAIDNNDRLPMQVSTNDGGTSEFVNGPNAFRHFAAMSNELSTPKVLLCPSDKQRTWATNFTSDLANAKISYFVGVDCSGTNQDWFLSGDRNLTNDLAPVGGMQIFPPQTSARWTAELHQKKGNLLFADGSVLYLSNSSFKTPNAINRLSIP
jgi:prepilin-type processing-associated H-X9-DG protein